MLQTAAQLLQRQGYHATGLKQILDESGAPRGSLYFHFPGGKEQLAVEALRETTARIARAIERTLGGHKHPQDAVRAFVHGYGEVLRRSHFTDGCPVATVTLDSAAASESIRAACAAAYAHWHGQLRDCFAAAGLKPTRADELATFALAAVEGALILSRARHDTRAFDVVADQLAALIHAAVDSPQPARRGRRRP